MRIASLSLLILNWKAVCAALFNEYSKALAVEFVRRSSTSSALILHCFQKDNISPAKFFSLHGVMSQYYHIDYSLDITRALNVSGHLSIVVDLSCSQGPLVMDQAAKGGFVGRRQHWLLLTPNTSLIEDIFHESLTLDSDVVFVDGDSPGEVRDVYRTGEGLPLVLTTPQSWSPGQTLAPSPIRNNLQGAVLKTVIVEAYDSWSHHDDLTYKHLNTWGKTHYIFIRLLSQRLNFSMDEIFTDTWGYSMDASNGSYNGLVGILQRGGAEIGGTALCIKKQRMVGVDYTAETGIFTPSFIFRQPSLSSVSNIYILPFSRGVWATYLSTLLGLTGLLVAMQRFMGKFVLSPHESPIPMWRDVVFRTFGVLCNEGYPENPETLSSRIVLLSMLILSVFHLTSYSACVVSLLQTPSTGFDNLHELVKSPMEMGMQEASYSYNYVNETDNPNVQALFNERLFAVPRSQSFLSMEEGIRRVRRGMFAFHVDTGAFKFVRETFLEHEKCGLRRVIVFPIQMLSIPVRKKSPYRKVFTRSIRWLKETGLIDRELKRWSFSKPECSSPNSAFVSVGLLEFSPILAMLFIGMATAVLLLIFEIVGFCNDCKRCITKTHKFIP